jgi:hypothetical protein
LPALTGITARLTSRFVGDPRDIHAAVLIGFLAELATIDTTRPRIMLRLRWAAYRAGLACLREALDAPIPSTSTFHTTPTTGPGSLAPAGHPDLVLAAAVAAGVITTAEAELIGSTRLEDMPLAQAAARRGSSYEATRKARQRAEHRLAAHLHILDTDTDTDTDLPYDASAAAPAEPSRTVAVMRMSATRRRRVRRRVSPNPGSGGVQVRVPDRPGPVRVEPLVHPAPPTTCPGPTPEVPRCA